MAKFIAALVKAERIRHFYITEELKTEFFRKGIHLLIALVPFAASINFGVTFALLGAGTIIYSYAEALRFAGREVFLVSRITYAASRERDKGKYVLGPITLSLGAMLALMLYPSPAAAIAIYALAFGDSVSSIIGKLFGTVRLPFKGEKTFAGSLACFIAVFLVTYKITGEGYTSLIIAIFASLLEALPTGDMDNIIIPVGTGFAAVQLLF